MAEQRNVRVGGSFATPVTELDIVRYEELAQQLDGLTRQVYDRLLEMLKVFRMTGKSKLAGTPHPSGRGTVIPLEDAEVARMERYVPWPEEINMYSGLFGQLRGEVRDAAFKLLWYAGELANKREPITTDTL